MPKPLLRVLVLLLVVVAAWRINEAQQWIGFDDTLIYAKTSGCILGIPLPTDPDERGVIDHYGPAFYEPHPGLNVPYLEFDLEYPPLLLAPIMLPQFVTAGYDAYCRVFALEMLAFLAGMIWLMRRMSRQLSPKQPLDGWTIAAYAAFFAMALGTFITRRFDTGPTFFAGAAIAAELAALSPLAGLLLGLGAAFKVWPGFLLAVFVLSAWADRDRRRAGMLVSTAAIGFLLPHLPFIMLGGRDAFSYLLYHGARGVQIESIWGNIGMWLSKLTSLESHFDLRFGATHLASKSGWTSVFTPLSYLAMLGSFLFVLKRTWDAARATTSGSLERKQVIALGSLGIIAATITTAKVLSPQYLVWLFPMAYVVPGVLGRRLRWTAVAAVALTAPIFPYMYKNWIMSASVTGLTLVLARNVAVVLLVWQVIQALGVLAKPQPMPAAEPTPDVQPA